jgi:hypothetical protein
MTQERLRELLRERVADETMPDRSGPAWRAARVVRRRRRLGAAAGVVVATVGVSTGIAVVGSTPPAPVPPPDRGISDRSEVPQTPDATYEGVPVWFSPDQDEEQQLPGVDGPLPADIDLDASRPFVPGELDHALAAFARGRSVVLVGPEGELRTVDLSRLSKVTKPNGYAYFPTSSWMLGLDGRQLVFDQPGRQDAVFTIATGEWSSAVGAVIRAGSPRQIPFDVSAVQRYGAGSKGAASWGMGLPLPVRHQGQELADPEFMLVNQAGFWDDPAPMAVLAFMWKATDGNGSRYKNCCPVAGWLDRDTVVYESRQDTSLLVAWQLGTDRFRLVSRIHGSYDVAGYAF